MLKSVCFIRYLLLIISSSNSKKVFLLEDLSVNFCWYLCSELDRLLDSIHRPATETQTLTFFAMLHTVGYNSSTFRNIRELWSLPEAHLTTAARMGSPLQLPGSDLLSKGESPRMTRALFFFCFEIALPFSWDTSLCGGIYEHLGSRCRSRDCFTSDEHACFLLEIPLLVQGKTCFFKS